MEWLRIRAPARLHLGFIPSKNGLGSAAVAISKPSLDIRMRESDEIHVSGAYSDEFFSMASSFLHSFSEGKGIEIVVESPIKRHIGLGSGTRMALSVGMGIDRIYGLGIGPYEIAGFFGRGRNSKAGLETLVHGGISIIAPDGTHENLRAPAGWNFVVALPEIEHRFFGDEERNAMRGMLKLDFERDLASEMVDSIRKSDIGRFGRLLTELDELTGAMFHGIQGGAHTYREIETVKEFGLKAGAYGAGQSSWGPAVYFLSDGKNAGALEERIQEFLRKNGGGTVFISEIAEIGLDISDSMENQPSVHELRQDNRIVYKS